MFVCVCVCLCVCVCVCVFVCVCVQERDTVELLDEDSQSILNIIKDTSTSHSLLSGESHDNHMTCIYNITCVSCAAPSANNSRSELPTVTSSGAAVSNSRVRHTHTHQQTHTIHLTQCGSFLRHKAATLRRLSSLTSATPTVNSGKTFVFQKASVEPTTQPSLTNENMVKL